MISLWGLHVLCWRFKFGRALPVCGKLLINWQEFFINADFFGEVLVVKVKKKRPDLFLSGLVCAVSPQ